MANRTLSLTEKLAKKKPSGKVAFLAQKDEIKLAMDQGWSKKDIWQQLHDDKKIPFSYPMFLRYVNELILNRKASQKIDNTRDHTTSSSKTDKQPEAKEVKKEPIKVSTGKEADSVFKTDPTRAATINKDDIY